jgi:hypothetical protein
MAICAELKDLNSQLLGLEGASCFCSEPEMGSSKARSVAEVAGADIEGKRTLQERSTCIVNCMFEWMYDG